MDDEIGRALSMQVSRRMHVGFWWETRRKEINMKT